MIRAKEGWRLLKATAVSWSGDYAPSMGAALSYYTLFSIAPLLIIVIAVAGIVFGDEAARGALFSELRGLTGEEGARAVEGMVQAADKPREGALATLIGVAVLLLGATTVFGELQNALDRIWRAPARAPHQCHRRCPLPILPAIGGRAAGAPAASPAGAWRSSPAHPETHRRRGENRDGQTFVAAKGSVRV